MSTRPPIPQGPPPAYVNMVTRVYKRSLRPVVLFSASASAVWTLLWGVSNFRDISHDRDDSIGFYVTWDIILGALFCGAAAIEVFGIVATAMQRAPLVRLYSFGTIVAALLVFGAQIINIVLDFKFENKLIDLCTTANTNDTVIVSNGWWGSTREQLTADQAHSFCSDLLHRQIVADFAWLIVTTILAALFATIVFAYYRQMLDPSFSRAPSNQIRMQAFQPPPGPPPGAAYGGPYGGQYGDSEYVPAYDAQKLPGYEGAGRQTPEKEMESKVAFGQP